VVVPAVRDHRGGLTRREARGRAEPGGAVAGHATGPAPAPLVARVDVEPPARRNPPSELPSTVLDERWRPFPLQGFTRSTRRSMRSSLGPSRLAARVPGRRIGVARLAEEPVAVPTPRALHPNPGRQEPARFAPVCVLDSPAHGRSLTPCDRG
jgi:hypothetical protein